MTLNLDNVGTVFGILAGAATFLIFVFAILRYIIRAETRELRPNGGSTIKDKVTRVEDKLDEHITASANLIAQGSKDKGAIEERQAIADRRADRLEHALSELISTLPVIAQSTPPEEPHA